jgi:SAM-dependent methyltransferase
VSPEDPKRIVAAGYDAIADRFAEWAEAIPDSPRVEWVDELLRRLPDGSDVLELGIGAGVDSSRLLADRHRLTGVDISAAQLERARPRLPGATLLHGDMTGARFEPASFDAVVSLYALTHVPRAEVQPLLGHIAGWLREGGLLLATLGAGDSPGTVDEDWNGAPMFFSGFDPETNRALLRAAGFELARDEVIAQHEPGHDDVRFHWVLARRP